MSVSPKKTRMVTAVIVCVSIAVFYFGYGSHSEWVDFGFRLLNFILFVLLLWHLAGPRIKNFLRGRSEGIATELEGLEQAKTRAYRHLKEVEAKIINLDKERQAILAACRAQGEAIKSEIIIKAEKNARQIIAQARLNAQNETARAMQEMRAEIAEEILETTKGMLRKQLDAQTHEKLIDKSLSKVVWN